jgi:hypothetical protein
MGSDSLRTRGEVLTAAGIKIPSAGLRTGSLGVILHTTERKREWSVVAHENFQGL